MKISCWCGNTTLTQWNSEYVHCSQCETLHFISSGKETSELYTPTDENHSLYGANYWLNKTFSAYQEMGCEDMEDALLLHYRERGGVWLNAITRHLLPPARVIEVGCGLGTLSRWMRDLGYSIEAVELSAAWCEYLRKTVGIPVVNQELSLPEQGEQPVESIILMDVFEHIDSPLAFMEIVKQRIAVGGLLFMQMPAYPAGASFDELQFTKHRFLRQLLPMEHLHLYSQGALKAMMTQVGFVHACQFPTLGSDDMLFVFSQRPLQEYTPKTIKKTFMSKPECISAYAAYVNYQHIDKLQIQNDEQTRIISSVLASRKKQAQTVHEQRETHLKPPVPVHIFPAEIKKLLFIRMDGIGDAALSTGFLETLPRIFPRATITLVCDTRTAPLFEDAPMLEKILPLDKYRLESDDTYLRNATRMVQACGADAVINATYSPTPGTASLLLSANAPLITTAIDDTNISAEDKGFFEQTASILIPAPAERMDIERYLDMLRHFDPACPAPSPKLWFSAKSANLTETLWAKCGFTKNKTIALFSQSNIQQNQYDRFGLALADICVQNGFSVAAFGGSKEYENNEKNLVQLSEYGVPTHNFSGSITLGESAAFIAQCRLAVGVNTGLSHIAAISEVPLVVLLGGGTFGRFFPYSPQTTAVCLPLDCYGCKWQCRHESACTKGVLPETVAQAVSRTLAQSPQQARRTLFMQRPETWPRQGQRPVWRSPAAFINTHKSKKHDGLDVVVSV